MDQSISKSLKSQLKKIFWITVGWTMISVFQFLNGYVSLLRAPCDLTGMSAALYFEASILTGILAGIFGGSGIVFLWEGWLRSKRYGQALLFIFLSYSVIYLMVSVPTGLFFNSLTMGLSIDNPQVWGRILDDHLHFGQLQSYIFWLAIVLGTLIALLVNDKYGPGVFRDFLLGKYFQPKREERIFMFLDLRSSTRIAEKLGEVRYFNFLNDVFKHVTASILHAKGEIYQYVGDEIVVSWKMNKGMENANCIKCFFNIQLALRRKSDYYLEHYGIEPEFKAGLHYGYVMAGEIGVVKRDIAFSGDVLNTTARIQSKCNEFGVNILLSKLLLDKLALPPHTFDPQKIGDIPLRGKREKVMLYTV